MSAVASQDLALKQSSAGFYTTTSIAILILSATYVYLQLFIIPKFELIFDEALPGTPLPALTLFVLPYRIPLAFIAFIWPIAGIILAHRRPKIAKPWLYIGILLIFLSTAITVFALFQPMFEPSIGMSDKTDY